MDTHHRQAATHLNLVHTHPKQAATLQQLVDTLHRQVATLQQPAHTHHRLEDSPREEDIHLRLVGSLLQPAVSPQHRGVTLLRQGATLAQLEASLLRLEDTRHSLEQEVIPPNHQQEEAGVQHLVALERSLEGLHRDTQGAPLRVSPCQITPEPPPLTPPCLDLEVEFHPTLRHLLFIKVSEAQLKIFQELIH